MHDENLSGLVAGDEQGTLLAKGDVDGPEPRAPLRAGVGPNEILLLLDRDHSAAFVPAHHQPHDLVPRWLLPVPAAVKPDEKISVVLARQPLGDLLARGSVLTDAAIRHLLPILAVESQAQRSAVGLHGMNGPHDVLLALAVRVVRLGEPPLSALPFGPLVVELELGEAPRVPVVTPRRGDREGVELLRGIVLVDVSAEV
mmetsp:Transcript_10372/g.29396  ORF Transcript_10372/g.29396 Transcript_10372/m.29396 type:complete len:200 (-) Transcript_10372:613-1212(-)